MVWFHGLDADNFFLSIPKYFASKNIALNVNSLHPL